MTPNLLSPYFPPLKGLFSFPCLKLSEKMAALSRPFNQLFTFLLNFQYALRLIYNINKQLLCFAK